MSKRTRLQRSVMAAEDVEGDQFRQGPQGSVGTSEQADRYHPLSPRLEGEGGINSSLGGDLPLQGPASGLRRGQLTEEEDEAPIRRLPIAFAKPEGVIVREDNMDKGLVDRLWDELTSHITAKRDRRTTWERLQPASNTCILMGVISKKASKFDANGRACRTCRSTHRGAKPRPCALYAKIDGDEHESVLFLPLPGKMRAEDPNDRGYWVWGGS